MTDPQPLHPRPRPWLDAAAIFLITVGLAATGVSRLWSVLVIFPIDAQPWLSIGFTAIACVGVGLKYAAPRVAIMIAATAFLADLVSGGGLGPLIAVLDVLWAATVVAGARRRRTIFLATMGAALVIVVAILIRTGSAQTAAVFALQLGALAGMSYWWATSVAQARELAALHATQRQAAIVQAERERADALRGERERMARELHDLVAGHVSAVALRAEAALVASADAGDQTALRAVRASAIEAHDAMRSMIAVLRTDDGVLAAPLRSDAIGRLVEDARQAGLTVTLTGTADGLPGAVDQAVTRVVQEAVANAARHAAGGTVTITLTADASAALVTVHSADGVQTSDLSGSGWGLELLRERVSALGGTFDAGPTAGGWLVAARIPLEASR